MSPDFMLLTAFALGVVTGVPFGYIIHVGRPQKKKARR